MTSATERRPLPAWFWVGLGLILVFDVWWRLHTIAPTIRDAVGFAPWPMVRGGAEPLDCDEAAYGYIGREIAGGAAMYRDLSENKPPLGYWLYALAVAIGGANETAIRLMPLPYVLATVAMVAGIAARLAGPAAGLVAALAFAVVGTDPFLYGNGANMEHFFNAFAVAALGATLLALDRPVRRGPIAVAGAMLAAATLVKQVAVAEVPVLVVGLMLARPGPIRARARDLAAFAAGFLGVVVAAGAVIVAQGAGRDAVADVIEYGSALATIKVRDPGVPSPWVRWLTGNADPAGNLPWPWGRTDYLVWWGTGSWPIWLAAAACVPILAFRRVATPHRRLVAAWTAAAGLEVVAPRLYWQHYYLLPVPGLAIAVAAVLADAVRGVAHPGPAGRRTLAGLGAAGLSAALLATGTLQVREYLLVEPEELTARDKGGRQWITLRAMGQDLRRRCASVPDPTLYIWGWQSPLFLYGDFDGVTRHFFADPLLEDYARGFHRDHSAVRPRVERILADLQAHPPTLVFVANAPFPELRRFLDQGYIRSSLVPRSPDGRGLWVAREHYAAFEAGPRPGQPAATATGAATRPDPAASTPR